MQARKRRGGKQVRGEKVKVYKESSGDGELAQPWFTPLWTWGTVLAVVACLLHSMHVAALFENDRFFSYLSSLERELSFRTEMGLYYSYYKRIVEAPSLSGGVASILHDNITEYPTTINTLQRFNLYPELCLSVMYRGYHWMLGVAGTTGTKCLTISRGYGQSSIEACNGLGDPAYFYVHMIFALNGIFASVIALLGTYLSGSVWGGVFSLTAFFYNHRQATRVMWTPPLRESFALPFLLLQSLLLTVSIRQRSLSRGLWTGLALSTLAFLLPWQFSQFTLLTQVLSLSVVHSVRLIPSHTFLHILSAFSVAYVGNIVLQFGNVMLLTSFLPYCLLACAVLCVVVRLTDRLKYLPLITVVEVCLVVVASVGLKTVVTSLMGSREDEHIMSILRSKFTSYHDFHTQLYTCAAEFDFLSLTYWLDITWTLMLPMSLVVMVMVTVQVVRHVKWSTATVSTTSSTVSTTSSSVSTTSSSVSTTSSSVSTTSSAVSTTSSTVSTNLAVQLYHVMQTMAYVVMATLIMRLKSFLTPQLSVMCGILPAVVSSKSSSVGKWRVWIFSGLLVLSSLKGWHNLHLEQSVSGEYNNPQGEELVMWIHDHTPKSAVFAGSMPTMATVLLTTGRPIVNHPHYESASLRNRTKHVYTVFSRKPAPEIHAILHGMGVHYVICEDSWCRRTGYKPGCSFREMWDEEDPGNQDRPLFCEEIRRRVPTPFLPAFTNSEYRVLQVATVNNTM